MSDLEKREEQTRKALQVLWARHSEEVMDPDGFDRWRESARQGRGHDMCGANNNSLRRLVATIDRLAALSVGEGGYRDAFFKIAALLDIPAQPRSPREVWETEMYPKLLAKFSTPGTRVEGLEEAARVAENAEPREGGFYTAQHLLKTGIAAAIRALKHPTGREG